jgi:hypothetical protein
MVDSNRKSTSKLLLAGKLRSYFGFDVGDRHIDINDNALAIHKNRARDNMRGELIKD